MAECEADFPVQLTGRFTYQAGMSTLERAIAIAVEAHGAPRRQSPRFLERVEAWWTAGKANGRGGSWPGPTRSLRRDRSGQADVALPMASDPPDPSLARGERPRSTHLIFQLKCWRRA